MFTLLVTEERRGGVKGLWDRLFHNRPKLEEHHTLDIPWRLIRAPVGKNGPDWDKIERLAGCHCSRLVSATHHQPPPDSRVKTVRLMAFQRILAARAVCLLLGDEPYHGVVGVIDPRARCLSAVEILLEKVGSVKVYTQLPERYRWFARRMLEQKGAPVVLCDDPKGFDECSCVLLGGLCDDWHNWINESAVVFSAAGEGAMSENTAYGFEPDCPPKLRQQIPQGVPPADLCSALYQFAACHRLSKLMPQSCRIKGTLTQIKDLRPLCRLKKPAGGQ